MRKTTKIRKPFAVLPGRLPGNVLPLRQRLLRLLTHGKTLTITQKDAIELAEVMQVLPSRDLTTRLDAALTGLAQISARADAVEQLLREERPTVGAVWVEMREIKKEAEKVLKREVEEYEKRDWERKEIELKKADEERKKERRQKETIYIGVRDEKLWGTK